MKRITTFCFVLVLGATLAFSQQVQPASPQQILDKMVSVYASCNNYADEGRVETIFFQNSGRSRTSVKPFSTAFVRPSRFRFEFENTDNNRSSHYVVWQEGASVKSWWTIKPETRSFENLAFALAGAVGVSFGAAINVPSMLMSSLGGTNRMQSLSQLELKGEQQVGDQTAYKVEGKDRRNNLITLWIDKERFLLLKIYETKTFEDFRTEQTTTYRPEINTNIPPEKLAFNH